MLLLEVRVRLEVDVVRRRLARQRTAALLGRVAVVATAAAARAHAAAHTRTAAAAARLARVQRMSALTRHAIVDR